MILCFLHSREELKDVTSIETDDGAIVIVNIDNVIGLNEIEQAFRAMPGVDPVLIPRDWVQNHYKWVVWKLASYDQNFSDRYQECLTVENVISQLKYR